ncbi:MAG: hypothetical protein KC583_01110, partial [Myxococcales bacterium]|nr:hypothetical protein [Myxococcales bacterium]
LERMAARVHATLALPDASDLARANALALLEAGYAAGGGRLPAAEALPEGVRDLRVMHLRKQEPTGVTWQLAVRGVADAADTVRGLRVLRGDAVVLDSAAGVGAWSVEPEDDGGHFYELEGPERAAPLDEGAYWIELGTDRTTTLPFVLGGVTAFGAPRVESPAPGEITGPRPTLRFEDYRSPTHQPWEPRTLGAWIVPAPVRSPWRPAWSFWTDRPHSAPAAIDRTLPPGDYWFGLTFGESRRFGPLTLVRASRVAVPFRVGG